MSMANSSSNQPISQTANSQASRTVTPAGTVKTSQQNQSNQSIVNPVVTTDWKTPQGLFINIPNSDGQLHSRKTSANPVAPPNKVAPSHQQQPHIPQHTSRGRLLKRTSVEVSFEEVKILFLHNLG